MTCADVVNGAIQIKGGKLAIHGGKIATADACCGCPPCSECEGPTPCRFVVTLSGVAGVVGCHNFAPIGYARWEPPMPTGMVNRAVTLATAQSCVWSALVPLDATYLLYAGSDSCSQPWFYPWDPVQWKYLFCQLTVTQSWMFLRCWLTMHGADVSDPAYAMTVFMGEAASACGTITLANMVDIPQWSASAPNMFYGGTATVEPG